MKTNKSILIVVLVLLLAGSSFSQSSNAADQQKNLARMAGRWECKDLQMVLGDKSYTGSFYFNAVLALDGKGIYAEEGFDHPELGSMRGLNLLGYDPNLKIIHWYTIDDRGTCHDHLGYWTDNNTFYAQYQGIVEDKIYVEKIYFSFENSDRISFRLVGEMNGIVSEAMTGIFKKTAQK